MLPYNKYRDRERTAAFFGHVVRMEETRVTKKVYGVQVTCRRMAELEEVDLYERTKNKSVTYSRMVASGVAATGFDEGLMKVDEAKEVCFAPYKMESCGFCLNRFQWHIDVMYVSLTFISESYKVMGKNNIHGN